MSQCGSVSQLKKLKVMSDKEKLKYFLSKKTIYGPKNEPVWVYLEREMRENIDKKPYNEKVGAWLKYLKELRYFFHKEALQKLRNLKKDVGPVWFIQLSGRQASILRGLKGDIHKDLIEDLPQRTQTALRDIGITPKLPDSKVMSAMQASNEDPGLFIWNLFKETNGLEPSILKKNYSMNEMILMSSLVVIDFDECIEELENLTHQNKSPPPPPPPKNPPPKMPSGKLGMYLQVATEVPLVKAAGAAGRPAKHEPLPLGNKFKPKSESLINRARMDKQFLEKRADRNKTTKQETRAAKYKFWEAPIGFRGNANTELLALQKMFKRRPKVRHETPYDNLHYHVGGVTYSGGRPVFIINNAVTTKTGYIPVHGGLVVTPGGYTIPVIGGMFKFPEIKDACAESCDCMKWEDRIMRYLEESKCKCGHLYDLRNEGRTKARFFTPPTRHSPFQFNEEKIFNEDPRYDFIDEAIAEAVRSETPPSVSSTDSIAPTSMGIKSLIDTLLSEVASTALIIPHLPQASALPALREWCRQRLKGDLTDKEHKRNMLYTRRKWEDLGRVDFKARAYRIPFTEQELHNMTWSHRNMVGQLFRVMLDDFVLRNRIKQLEQARLYWASMMYEKYPNRQFLETFFTYLPGRLVDTYFINPYSTFLTKAYGAKTCPL